jgi:hypothetical protein
MADEVTCSLCELCTLRSDAERAMNACEVCALELGLVPMAYSRRPPLPCTRCNGHRFTRVIPREHTSVGLRFTPTDATGTGDIHRSVSAPMVATHVPRTIEKLASAGRTVVSIDIRQGFGRTEMFVCRGCGFVEWYIDQPETIPIGPHYMTEDIDYSSPGPYR